MLDIDGVGRFVQDLSQAVAGMKLEEARREVHLQLLNLLRRQELPVQVA